jgi:hypothetical protein
VVKILNSCGGLMLNGPVSLGSSTLDSFGEDERCSVRGDVAGECGFLAFVVDIFKVELKYVSWVV